jgi:hypothetical protein
MTRTKECVFKLISLPFCHVFLSTCLVCLFLLPLSLRHE